MQFNLHAHLLAHSACTPKMMSDAFSPKALLLRAPHPGPLPGSDAVQQARGGPRRPASGDSVRCPLGRAFRRRAVAMRAASRRSLEAGAARVHAMTVVR